MVTLRRFQKKRMDGHFSNPLRLLKNGQKSDSFAAHFEQKFNTTKSLTYLHKHMAFKLVNQIKQLVRWKHLRNLIATYIWRNVQLSLKSYVTNTSQLWTRIWIFMGPADTKRISIDFYEAPMIPFLTGERIRPLNGFSDLMTCNHQQPFLNTEILLK